MITARIDDFVAGDNVSIERTVTIPSGVSIQTAWLTVKRRYSDIDPDAIISKLITSVLSTDGKITGTGLLFKLTPEDTSILTALSEYPYSIKLKYSDTTVSTFYGGIIMALPAVKQGST